MCMCGGGAHGPGTNCQWCGVGNGVPNVTPDHYWNGIRHSASMKRMWGDLWDEPRNEWVGGESPDDDVLDRVYLERYGEKR